MSDKRARYVIAYDIPDDRRRTKMAHTLEGHGERVQYSVFECQLTAVQFERLWKALLKLLRAEEDSLRAYRLCAECVASIKTEGQARVVEEVPAVFIV